MFRACLLAGLAALTLARPDTYKEKEDFQYARSSTDEGAKSGFYEAQRGNVGGNYERAHNMDHVAQGQMSDLVSQVGGQAGEVADARRGELFGSAYNRGVYGQRHWDTANLAGRSFQEGTYMGSQTASASTSHAADSSALRYEQYAATQGRLTDTGSASAIGAQSTYGPGLAQDTPTYRAGSAYGAGSTYGAGTIYDAGSAQRVASTYGAGSAFESSGRSSSSGYRPYSGLSQHRDDMDQHSVTRDQGSRYTIVPVRVVVRPLTPVTAHSAAHAQFVGATLNRDDERRSSAHSLSGIVQGDDKMHTGVSTGGGLDGKDKHYESSYQYRKEWEKHYEVTPIPLSIVTSNPLSEPVTSFSRQQAYDQQRQFREHTQSSAASGSSYLSHSQDHTAQQADTSERGYQSGLQYQRVAEPIGSRYVVVSRQPEFVVAGTIQGSFGAGQSQHASSYRTGSRSDSQTAYADASHIQGHLRTNDDSALAATSQNRDALTAISGTGGSLYSAGTAPKKYESSYSYHKSWERQGDPYVIVPASTGTVSQSERLQTSTDRALSHYPGYGSHSGTHADQEDCDETQRHVRSAQFAAFTEDLGQQGQTSWRDREDEGQQVEDLGQQVEDLGQQVEDSGQQVESTWETSQDLSQQQDLGQQSIDLGQHVEGSWEKPIGSQGLSHLEDLGQHNQEHLGQQVVDLGQQVVDPGQQVEGAWETSSNPTFGTGHQQETIQHAQTSRDQRTQLQAGISDGDWGQQVQSHTDYGQQQYSGFEQPQVQDSQGAWMTTDEYIRQIQQAAKDLEKLSETNRDIRDKQHETSFIHSYYGKHSEQGQHFWEGSDQRVHDSFAHSEHQDGWEETHHQQQTHHFGYYDDHGMQQSWKPLAPEGLKFNSSRERETDYSRSGTMPPLWKPFAQEELEPKRSKYDKPQLSEVTEATIVPIDDKKETVLRGDLGTELPTETTIKSLTDKEFEEHFSVILSNINTTVDRHGGLFEPTSFYVPVNKVKTPEEIESLSLVNDSDDEKQTKWFDQHTEKKSAKHFDFDKKIEKDASFVYHPQIQYTVKELDSQNKDHSQKPDVVGQESESLDQTLQNEGQQTISGEIVYQQSEDASILVENKSEEQMLEHSARELKMGHRPLSEVGSQSLATKPRDVTRVSAQTVTGDQPITNKPLTSLNHYIIDQTDSILNHGLEKEHTELTSENHDSDQLSEDLGQHVESSGQIVGEMGQEKLSLDQQTTDLGQETEDLSQHVESIGQIVGEMGQETLNLDQHTTYLGQETEDLSQRVESTDQTVGEMGQETLSLDQHATDLGQETEDLRQHWREDETRTYNPDQQTQDLSQKVEILSLNQEDQPSQHDQQFRDLDQQVQSFHEEILKSKASELEVQPLEIDKKDTKKADLTNPPTDMAPKSESPGFWKKVGNKITVAKDKVSCWFSRCA